MKLKHDPEADTTVLLRCAPPPDAPHADQMNWLMETACELGRMASHFSRQLEARDEQLTLIFAYMHGRALGCYIPDTDERGQRAIHAMFQLGVEHGKLADSEDDQFEAQANAEGTETRQ